MYCVGQNYAAHAREMGGDSAREAPFFFTKPAQAILPDHAVMPYPPGTSDLQHEVELVVALGVGGRNIPLDQANAYVFGYAVGLDMTRRDVQRAAKAQGRPWDMSKGFDYSAPCAAITPVQQTSVLVKGKIELLVNGVTRQQGDIGDMIWTIPEIIAYLSAQVELFPGDLIFTGTPAGVGAVVSGDVIEARVAGLEPLTITIG
jgi:fumarylpyruvate hydrolase